MLNYLSDSCYVEYDDEDIEGEYIKIGLTPKGYSRVDEIQKNTAHGRNVLVAMKFGDDTIPLREAIRKGIQDAGYHAVFIDEVQHNDFITPELLKYIRDSKFVVVDLTHQNNGAYFEEGYAMGLGKPVIQLCQKDTHLHFDIAQKNTIMWTSEDDIPERLTNRIKATID
jgi:nucleoside 2-deoxyribosyltransferase